MVSITFSHVASASAVTTARELAAAGRVEDAFNILERDIMETSDEDRQRRNISCMVGLSCGGNARRVSFLNHALSVKDHLKGDNKAYLLFHIGKRYAQLHDYVTSSDFLRRSLTEENLPPSRWTWSMKYQIGQNARSEGKYDEAMKAFEQLKDDPLTADKHRAGLLDRQTASTLFDMEDWPKLVHVAEPLLQKEGTQGVKKLFLLDQLGFAYYRLGDAVSATRIYREFLRMHEQLYPKPNKFQKAKRQHIVDLLRVIGEGDPLLSEVNITIEDIMREPTPPASSAYPPEPQVRAPFEERSGDLKQGERPLRGPASANRWVIGIAILGGIVAFILVILLRRRHP